MPLGTENPLFLMSGDFKFYCLQFKNPVEIPKILVFFQVGMRVQCIFPMGMEFQGIFLTGAHRGEKYPEIPSPLVKYIELSSPLEKNTKILGIPTGFCNCKQ